MKTTILSVIASFAMVFYAAAQTPRENHWDITKIDVSKLPTASAQKDVSFEKDILPMLKASCVRCHGAMRPKGGLRLDSLEAVLKGGRDGKMVSPGDSAKSLLVVAAAQIDPATSMPPKRRRKDGPEGGNPPPGGPPPGDAPPGGPPPGDGPPGGHPPDGEGHGPGEPGARPGPPKALTTDQVALLRAWIDQGAH